MGKQVTELDTLPSFTDTSLLPVHNGAGLKKGSLSQLADYIGTKFSNPNLIINPDFKINQRGETSYTSAVAQTIKIVYSVDRWCLYGHSLTVNSDKSVTITPTTYSDGALIQNLETPVDGDITIQIYAVSVSGTATISVGPSDGSSTTEIGILKNGLNTFTFSKGIKRLVIRVKNGTLTLKYAKVEKGTVATPFVAPNPSEELVKCRRYYTIIGNTLIGYVMSSVSFYMGFTEPLNIRKNGTIAMKGDNSANYLRCGGKAKAVNIDTSRSMYDLKYIRLYFANPTSAYDSMVCALDCSSAIIVIDAEIY